jgi:hypothetical protein
MPAKKILVAALLLASASARAAPLKIGSTVSIDESMVDVPACYTLNEALGMKLSTADFISKQDVDEYLAQFRSNGKCIYLGGVHSIGSDLYKVTKSAPDLAGDRSRIPGRRWYRLCSKYPEVGCWWALRNDKKNVWIGPGNENLLN